MPKKTQINPEKGACSCGWISPYIREPLDKFPDTRRSEPTAYADAREHWLSLPVSQRAGHKIYVKKVTY